MDDNVFREFRCAFYERTDAGDGLFRYERAYPATPDGSGELVTTCPPSVGDLVWLWSQEGLGPRGMFQVIERAWRHPSFGSMNWPHVGGVKEGPSLDIIVVGGDGPFRNEAPSGDEVLDTVETL
ncbi:MAG: hypothetical protein KA758_14710 [Acidimicrobiales bacterium]|nr:hypothetical protein [Acidimicrobiales bacterium]